MVDAGVSAVLAKLSEVASIEATALLKVDEQIRTLRRSLGYLQAVVRGADQQRRGRANELLLLWVGETRQVAFDVEDAVDEFHLKVETFEARLKWGHAWFRSVIKLLNGLPMQIVARHVLSREITKINERVKEIEQIKETYKIESTPSEIWSVSTTDASAIWDIKDGRIEFREAEFKTLKDYILNTNKVISHRAVISIIGESGTGKTRLARNLYNDHHIHDQFEVLVWICLPPHIRFDQYVEMIYEKVCTQVPKERSQSGTPSRQEVGQTSEKLRRVLKGTKYLVVLDGLVDISHWNSLLDLLPADNSESRVVFTSKLNREEIMHADKKIKPKVLGPLDNIQAAKLFHERVFGADHLTAQVDETSDEPAQKGVQLPDQDRMASWKNKDTMRSFENRVYNLSRGLPLAVVVLGGVLRAKAYPSEWEDVFTQKLETSTGQPKGMRCLWSLAFEDLPPRLKSCFLYLATASQNVYLDPDRLVRLWIAEGFVSPKKSETLEEVGLGYLKELVCRGLLEVVERDARGGIKVVVVHSLLHSFLDSEAQESSFLEINHHANVLNPHLVRRLAIHNFVDSYVDIPNQFPKLRSLLCNFLEEQQDLAGADELEVHRDWDWGNLAEWFLRACGSSSNSPAAGSVKLHHLGVIRGSRFLRVIDLYGVMLARLPDEIGSIIHLRYLGVRSCRLSELPASISKLVNLQTLDVRRTRVTHVPDGLWEIQLLRHVLAERLLLSKCPTAHLRNMQTLVGTVPAGPCPLNHMMYLRTLTMCSVPEAYVGSVSSALKKMEFLVSLSLSGRLLPSSIFSSPSSRRLEVLALHGILDWSPESQLILPNLGKLTLSGSGIVQIFIDKVAALPNLTEMELLEGSYVQDQLVFSAEGFLSLTRLNLTDLEQLEKLELVAGSAPKLAVLTKCGCESMEIIDNRSYSEVASVKFTSKKAVNTENSPMTIRSRGDDETVTSDEEIAPIKIKVFNAGYAVMAMSLPNRNPEEY